ncbi:MAG: RdgB/HAM1 family non-canonical purine NTP pyrophosphatase [Pseudomonadota bacterium]|jgi:XTP/dITP diphosphohydrolase|nr:MAG: non-canonical purine NTP pyrophosphatase, RdgB/HAM1 family [Pseudomonadota bacterium]
MPAPRRVVLATGNAGKQREFAALLAPLSIEVITQAALGITAPEETGATFEENALLKARHAARAAGLPALADDSGIEVDALGGRPGVYSARYAGPSASDADNNALLLAALAGRPDAERSARYRCVIAYVRSADDPAPLLARGTWEGRIATVPAGQGGFGYDPLFIPEGESITAAQMSPEAKNAVSHRGRALAALLSLLA